MAGSEVLFKDSVYKDLRRIPKTDLERILARIEQLGLGPLPPGGLKLTGAELCRVCQGNCRIVYK
jgi:mRNA interferase RelE/StbE